MYYEESESKLLDIATCKCESREVCKCTIKVPIAEETFLKDQRNERKIYIGSVDEVSTKSICRKETRKIKYDEFLKIASSIPSTSSDPILNSSSSSSSIAASDEDEDVIFRTEITTQSTEEMRSKLQNIATAYNRTGVSDRSAALIVNDALLDLNVISTENSSKVIDRSKIRRERKKARRFTKL
ncbi:hypothetical protein EVAR_30997_1 [Eumeta japonica]|uniref:Uncharacterized protein n=1 Tax=Eumeta variegata TaxID=151549 RepID=A0A4C1WA00_EUMVA|nr:hypothetical protein EVAR_30997_1 [Eumeta japonica]